MKGDHAQQMFVLDMRLRAGKVAHEVQPRRNCRTDAWVLHVTVAITVFTFLRSPTRALNLLQVLQLFRLKHNGSAFGLDLSSHCKYQDFGGSVERASVITADNARKYERTRMYSRI
jgi:hypothetical protein